MKNRLTRETRWGGRTKPPAVTRKHKFYIGQRTNHVCEYCHKHFIVTRAKEQGGHRGRFCTFPCYTNWLQIPGNSTHRAGPRTG